MDEYKPLCDLDLLNSDQLRDLIKDLETKITFGTTHGAEKIFVTMMIQDRRAASAELGRRNGNGTHKPVQENFWPELGTAEDLLKVVDDDTRWLWDKCLPFGACSMLVAKPKVGKSTLSVSLSIAVARGLTFLNRKTQEAPVIYIFLDGPKSDIAEQFRRAGLKPSDQVYWLASSLPDRAIDWAGDMIAKKCAKLLIVDTLQKFFKFKNLNDYSEVSNVMDPLLKISQESSCHVQFSHHAGKFALDDMDAAIGSTVLKGQGYSNLHVKKMPDSGVRILQSEQRGGKNFEEVVIEFENEDGTGLLTITGTRAQAEVKAVKPLVLAALNQVPQTEKDLRQNINARGMLVSMAVRDLVKDGEVETTGVKRSRSDPITYHIAGTLIQKGETQYDL